MTELGIVGLALMLMGITIKLYDINNNLKKLIKLMERR